MKEILDGEVVLVQGSASEPYKVRRIGEVIDCSCPAWRNQSLPINKRTCKHIRKIQGDKAESARIGGSLTMRAPKTKGKEQAVPPALLLANKWTPEVNPAGWWMSEKLDGIRALWTGKEFISRLGNKFYPPAWFIEGLPDNTMLDGELWMGRGKFQETMSIVRSQGLNLEWAAITYKIFDIPNLNFDFEMRCEAMRGLKLPNHCEIVEQELCMGVTHLRETLSKFEKLGGEGVMLRQYGSKYEGKRSNTLLKVKSFFDDEAVITGYEPGKGRHKGRLGGYHCKLFNGIKFSVGSGLTDKGRDNPLSIGTKITFRYCELTNDGVPRFSVFVSECVDK
ncbi:MAG: DNA ligase [Nanoarchaeota archaeon]|nr:DNA ligase [Nanoarchaeota archaeon]